MGRTKRFSALLVVALMCGCGSEREVAPPPEPLGVQLMRVSPELRTQKFSTLLNFETPNETAFVTTSPPGAKIDSRFAHTGKSSLLLPPLTQSVKVSLLAVLGDRTFPADWTLAG